MSFTPAHMERLSEASNDPELPFDRAEYEHRLDSLVARMSRDKLDAVIITSVSDISYLTGYDTAVPSAYAALLVQLSGDMAFFCADLEASAMFRTGWVHNVTINQYHGGTEFPHGLVKLLRHHRLSRSTMGIQLKRAEPLGGSALSAYDYQVLQSQMPAVTFRDCSAIVLEGRLIKSASELAMIKRAAAYTSAGMRAAIAATRSGVRENDIAASIYSALISAGSENPSLDPILITGPRTGWAPHLAFRRRKVNSGDTIYVELSGTHHRYNAPMCRTFAVGQPSPTLRQLAKDSLTALAVLLESLAPGTRACDVYAQVRRDAPFLAEGHAQVGNLGYSVGLAMKPCWTEAPFYLNATNNSPILPGMVFHLPINVWIPGDTAAIFSETVAITESGVDILTSGVERELLSAS